MTAGSSFTSYNGVEVRFIVKSLSVVKGGGGASGANAHNLYRDNETKNLINNLLHGKIRAAVSKGDSLPDVGAKGSVAGGIAKCGNAAVKGSATPTVDMMTLYK